VIIVAQRFFVVVVMSHFIVENTCEVSNLNVLGFRDGVKANTRPCLENINSQNVYNIRSQTKRNAIKQKTKLQSVYLVIYFSDLHYRQINSLCPC
jgi:hypothetical protein